MYCERYINDAAIFASRNGATGLDHVDSRGGRCSKGGTCCPEISAVPLIEMFGAHHLTSFICETCIVTSHLLNVAYETTPLSCNRNGVEASTPGYAVACS